MPVIWHEHIAAQIPSQLLPRFGHGSDEQRKLIFGENRTTSAQIHCHEENPVCSDQTLYTGHGLPMKIEVATARLLCRGFCPRARSE